MPVDPRDLPKAYLLLEQQCDTMIRQLEACSTAPTRENTQQLQASQEKIRSLEAEVALWKKK